MAYLGPETLIPLASVASAAAGIALLFWKKTTAVVKRAGRFGRNLVTRIVAWVSPTR